MWQAIKSNRLKSYFLVLAMGVLLVVLGAVFGGSITGEQGGILGGVMFAGIIWFFMTVVSVAGGKNILLAMSGAREVTHDDAPQLYNIVEEMRIAAALPSTPKVFIMESRSPNAFAVGTPGNAAVAVTTGILTILSRDELQGVVAHEVGHIKNEDTKFMTIAGVMLGTIVILADVYTRMMFYGGSGRRSRSSSREGGGQLQLILFLLAIIFAILAPLLANLLYLACSRSREYLADASGALFTRYPEGLASALEKISGARIPLESANRITAPMYIVNPLNAASGKEFSAIFSTHPPVEKRVAILRSMAGAGLDAYNRAYSSIMGKDIIPESYRRSDEELALRGVSVEPPPLPDAEMRKRKREAMDIFHRLNRFLFIQCPCGIKLKVPPTFSGQSMSCPRCGAQHQVVATRSAKDQEYPAPNK